jgi:hypothetical protein
MKHHRNDSKLDCRRRIKSPSKLPTKQKGVALVVVIILSAAFLMSDLMLANSVRTEMRIAQNQQRGVQAFYSAESGLNHVVRQLVAAPSGVNTILDDHGTGGVLANVGTGKDVTISDDNYRFKQFGGSGSTDGYYVRLEDNVDDYNPDRDTDKQVIIVSRGRAGDAERVLQGLVTYSVGYCLFATTNSGNGITISGGSSVIDSFNSAEGSYASSVANNANVGTNANVNASGGSTFKGNVSATGSIKLNPATITGTNTPGAPAQSFTPVPACTPYSGTQGLSGGSYTYSSSTGKLTVSSGNKVTMSPGTYCFNSITLTGGSKLIVDSGSGPIKVNLTGAFDFSGGNLENNTLKASNFQVFSSNSGSQNRLSGGTKSYLTVYSPNAPISMSGSSSVYGSLIGSTLTFSGGSGIHCDESAMGGTGGAGGGLKLLSLHQRG